MEGTLPFTNPDRRWPWSPKFPVRLKRRKTTNKWNKMKRKIQIALITVAVAASTLLVWSDGAENHTPTIEGVWQVSRVGVNCNDPSQQLGTPFPALMSFHRDGIVNG